jgi:hypothetical protein
MKESEQIVSYFSHEVDETGMPRRYFLYRILGTPGPTDEGGVASITMLAVYSERERCTSCQMVHAAPTGGPAAAVAKALRYLDAYHEGPNLRKVVSAIRGGAGTPVGSAR